MYLYDSYQIQPSAVGAVPEGIPATAIDGIQYATPAAIKDILAALKSLYLVEAASSSPAGKQYIALPCETAKASGRLDCVQDAATDVATRDPDTYVVVNFSDMVLPGTESATAAPHVILALFWSKEALQTFAPEGGDFAVIAQPVSVVTIPSETKAKSYMPLIIGALVGGGAGLVTAGPVGAAVGAGAGALVGNMLGEKKAS